MNSGAHIIVQAVVEIGNYFSVAVKSYLSLRLTVFSQGIKVEKVTLSVKLKLVKFNIIIITSVYVLVEFGFGQTIL